MSLLAQSVGGYDIASPLPPRNGSVLFATGTRIYRQRMADGVRSMVCSIDCDGIDSFDVSQDSSLIVAGVRSMPPKVLMLSGLDGSAKGTIENVGDLQVSCLRLTDDGKRVAILSSLPDYTLTVFDLSGPAISEVARLGMSTPFTSIAWRPNSSSQLVLYGGGSAQWVDLGGAGAVVARVDRVASDTVSICAASITHDGDVIVGTASGVLAIFNSSSWVGAKGSIPESISGTPFGFASQGNAVRAISCLENGAVLSIGQDGSLRFTTTTSSAGVPLLLAASYLPNAKQHQVLLASCDSKNFVVQLASGLLIGGTIEAELPSDGECSIDINIDNSNEQVQSQLLPAGAAWSVGEMKHAVNGTQIGKSQHATVYSITQKHLSGSLGIACLYGTNYQRSSIVMTAGPSELLCWSVDSGTLIAALDNPNPAQPFTGVYEAPHSAGSAFAAAANGNVWLVALDADNKLVLSKQSRPFESQISGIVASSKAPLAAVSCGSSVLVYNYEDSQLWQEAQCDSAVCSLGVHCSGSSSIVSLDSGKVWELPFPSVASIQQGSAMPNIADIAGEVATLQNSSTSVLCTDEGLCTSSGLSVQQLNEEGKTKALWSHEKRRIHLCFDAGSNTLASAADDGKLIFKNGSGFTIAHAWEGGCTGICAVSGGFAASTFTCGFAFVPFDAVVGGGTDCGARSADAGYMSVEDAESRTLRQVFDSQQTEVAGALHAVVKNETLGKVQELRERFNTLLKANSDAPEEEQLSRRDIVVDIETHDACVAEGKDRVQHARNEISKNDDKVELVRERLLEEVWESMDRPGAILHGLQVATKVPDFPLRKFGAGESKKLAIVRLMRKIELEELNQGQQKFGIPSTRVRREAANAGPGSVWSSECRPHRIVDLASATAATVPSDKKDSGKGGDAAEAADEGVDADGNLEDTAAAETQGIQVWGKEQNLLPSLDVTSRERRIAQGLLLLQEVRVRKQAFNAIWDEWLSKKRNTLNKIEEKNGRMLEILEELGKDQKLQAFSLAPGDIADSVLEVDDSEVSAERVMTEDEIQRQREEKEREANANRGGDDTVERALNDMMGGTLESGKDIKLLDRTVPQPAWFVDGSAPEGMNEQQLQELKEYETAVKALKEEQDKHRASLDSEFKKLQAETLQLVQGFDNSMQALADQRMSHLGSILEIEMSSVRHTLSVHAEEAAHEAIQLANNTLPTLEAHAADFRNAADAVAQRARVAADAADRAIAEDKAMERRLKKELTDFPEEISEPIIQLIAAKQLPPLEPPPGVDDVTWARFAAEIGARASMAEGTEETIAAARDANLAAESAENRAEAAEAEAAACMHRLEELAMRLQLLGEDVDLVMVLKQGLVEVPQAAVVTDMADAVMVSRDAIEGTNAHVKERGDELVSVLKEKRDFNRGIHVLRWENECLDLEMEELVARTRHLQLLRVTKDLQRRLSGKSDGQNNKMVSVMERRLEYAHAAHAEQVQILKKRMDGLETAARDAMRENAELDEDVLSLEAAIVERDRLADLQGSASAAMRAARAKATAKRMTTHRRLLDLAKAQTREIELMREELVRLRARTFPSFAQLQDSMIF